MSRRGAWTRWSFCSNGWQAWTWARRRWLFVSAPRARRAAAQNTDVQDEGGVAAGDAGLARARRGDDRGDAVDVDVLEGALLLPVRNQEVRLLDAAPTKAVLGRRRT